MSHTGYPYDIEMLPLGNYNHSVTPSCYSVLSLPDRCRKIFAARALQPGEEITLDFRDAPELEQPQQGKHWSREPRFRPDLPNIYHTLGLFFAGRL